MITDNNKLKTNSLLINGNKNIEANNLFSIPASHNQHQQQYQHQYQQQQAQQPSEINFMKATTGRTLSPAILAKSIQANRTIPLPGSSKRPPHLRLNNN